MELAVLALLQLIQRRAHHRVRRILQPAHYARTYSHRERLKHQPLPSTECSIPRRGQSSEERRVRTSFADGGDQRRIPSSL